MRRDKAQLIPLLFMIPKRFSIENCLYIIYIEYIENIY